MKKRVRRFWGGWGGGGGGGGVQIEKAEVEQGEWLRSKCIRFKSSKVKRWQNGDLLLLPSSPVRPPLVEKTDGVWYQPFRKSVMGNHRGHSSFWLGDFLHESVGCKKTATDATRVVCNLENISHESLWRISMRINEREFLLHDDFIPLQTCSKRKKDRKKQTINVFPKTEGLLRPKILFAWLKWLINQLMAFIE